MGFSALVDDVRLTTQKSSRQGSRVDHFIVHGAASTSYSGVINMMVNRTRQVSANYVVGDRIAGVVDESERAWTSGSATDGGKGAAWDRRSITVETINSTGAPGWLFSDKTFDNLARLIADCAERYGFDINDETIVTHQELWTRYRASYPTACPQDLQRRKGELISLARKYRVQGTPAGGFEPKQPEPEEEDMTYAIVPIAGSTEIYVLSLISGVRAHITSLPHLGLLKRAKRNDNNDPMLAGELDIVRGYLTAINPPPNVAVDVQALADALGKIDSDLDAEQIQAAVTAALDAHTKKIAQAISNAG